MRPIDLIRYALEMSDQFTMPLIEDMRDAPCTAPTPRGGNHPLWVLGHLAFVEALLACSLMDEPDPLPEYTRLFSYGAEPTGDADDYPKFDEVLATYRRLRARNMRLLEQFGDARLDEPVKRPPAGLEDAFRTVGQAFLVVAIHQMNHRGQVSDARRAAGRSPLFTPQAEAAA